MAVQCHKEDLGFLSVTTCFHDGIGRTAEKKWAPSNKERRKNFSIDLLI